MPKSIIITIMTHLKIMPVLLCGGAGTRMGLTPPKQFQPLLTDRPIIMDTAARVQDPQHFSDPIIITHQDYKPLIESLCIPNTAVLYEPVRRNTAAAFCLSALYAAQHFPNHPLLFLPCDHDIDDDHYFRHAILQADPHRLTCFGCPPLKAATDYGYIEIDALHNLRQFHEKPDHQTASRYIQNPNMLWNMGIYYALPQVFITAFQPRAPQILQNCQIALKDQTIIPDLYARNPVISFDHAVMEYYQGAAVSLYHSGWRDVGTCSDPAPLDLSVKKFI